MTDHTQDHRWLAAVATTLALLLLAATPATAAKGGNGDGGGGDGGNGNTGTVKVHDDAAASPPTRNEPHVDCADFWVEGFNMKADSGRLFIHAWPPTGDKRLVMEGNWSADGAAPKSHFLVGPLTLPAGHYQVWASNGPATADDGPGQMKKKTFWVDSCEAAAGMSCPSDLAAVPNGDGSVTLTWTPAPGSNGSNVYRATGDGDFEHLATTTAGTYTDHATQAGEGYAFTVTGLFGDQESRDCPVVEATAIPDFPTTLGIGLAAGGGALAMVLGGRRKA